MAQSFPEGLEGIRPLAVAHEDDGAAFQVEDHGKVAVPLLYRYLIDREVSLRGGGSL
jgi:hypothetical protein